MGFVGDILGEITGANDQADAAKDAGKLQYQAAQLGIDESRRQFDALQRVLSPFVNAGTGALGAQQALLGLDGGDAQQQAIAALQDSPQFQALTQQGENAILQNASATGGLRGGNVQSALAQFRPQLLAQLINDQYSKLGGLSSLGQNAAAGVGNAGIQTGGNIAQLLQQGGAAQAGAKLAAGNKQANVFNQVAGMAGNFFGGGFL